MLQGDKVVLRAIEREDLRALHGARNDLEVQRRVTNEVPTPKSLAAMEATFDAAVANPDPRKMSFAIVAADEVVGRLDLWGIDPFHGYANIGLSLRQQSWGKGYGSDAVRLITEHAFVHMNVRKMLIQCLADDERAVGAYKRAGFVEEGRLKSHEWFEGRYVDVLHMARFRDA